MSYTDIPLTGDEPCAKSADPELFFPFKGQADRIAKAKALCAVCPTSRGCLDYALDLDENPYGIWGGTTREERETIRRRRQVPARASVRRAS